MARPTVLLTDPIHPDAHARLAAQAEVRVIPAGLSPEPAQAALRTLLAGAHGLVVRRQLPDDLFDMPGTLQAVVRQGVGLDFIPVARATVMKLPVANTPAVNANAVAEYVFAAMFAASRQLAWFDLQVREGRWAVRGEAGARTHDLRGRTLGLIGYGAIGQRIAQIASAGFDMRLLAHTRTPSSLPSHVGAASLADLFAGSDVVVVACPLTPDTRGLVDANVLRHTKPGALLINVGRGPVVREADLVAALDAGLIGGAVLDVFEIQPLPADSGLRQHPGVILTPHLAGVTDDAERAMGLMAVDTVLALVRGERPLNVVNPEIYLSTESVAP